jgi:hypothetical protein
MSDWGWVTIAYVLVYGTLGTYLVSMTSRIRRVRRAQDGR